MTKYLMFIGEAEADARNIAIAQERGCGPVTTRWFNKLTNVDGRRAFSVPASQTGYLNQAEQDALADTLWYQNALSGDIYVAVTGAQGGDGSIGDPVNLATACSALSTIAVGSTIHVQAGDYIGDFIFIHAGTVTQSINLEFEPEARIKGSFTIANAASYVVLDNLTAFDTPTVRITEDSGSSPDIATQDGLSIFGANALVTHPFIEDVVLNGIGFWQSAAPGTLYGAWVLNNGWQGPDRGHGHGLYTQNEAGLKLIRNCMFAQRYGGSIRAFTTNQSMQNITIDKCICINDQLFLGGHSPASSIQIINNHVWNDGLEIGETDQGNVDVLIDGNYVTNFVNTRCLVTRFWSQLTVTNNTFVLRQNVAAAIWEMLRISPDNSVIDNNTYYYEPVPGGFKFLIYDYDTDPPTISSLSIAEWQALGFDVNSTFIEGLPTVNEVFVEHSTYEDDIAHVAIYNWELLASVNVDFSVGNFTLTNTYRAYNAMNNLEYEEFVYDGNPVSIPMTGWTRKIPSGATGALTSDTWPEFLALIVKAV